VPFDCFKFTSKPLPQPGTKTFINPTTELYPVGDKMRKIKREAKGISPIIATILLIAATAVAGGIIAAYVAGLFVPRPGVPVTARASGTIMDKDTSSVDNYKNAKVMITVEITSDDIDDVLDPTNPLKISLIGHGKVWSTGTIDLLATSGLTEADYGTTIDVDGVINAGIAGDNLYVRVRCPTTSDGELDGGMSLIVDMWPTDDATSPINSTISPATLDTATTADWWDERDRINITIAARADALTLTGYSGARLSGFTTT
jgi:flagellin-like protein